MRRKIVDTILPTTMVGSYPRPRWYTQQLLGRDVRVAFKEVNHEEAYHDATHAVIHDQEEAGLDIVTDGQMSYDDYVGVIGSFCWYWYERTPGFEPAREPHPSEASVETRDRVMELMHDWGGVINKCCEGVDAFIGWHFCFGNAWGNDILSANYPQGYQTVLPHYWDTPGIDQFVLDYANRDMAGIEFLANLPDDKEVQIGVLDIRSMMIESPEH